jgi:hypothetical protein
VPLALEFPLLFNIKYKSVDDLLAAVATAFVFNQ